MIKRTLYFGNPAYLSVKNSQLVINLPGTNTNAVGEGSASETTRMVPIEDIGVVVLTIRK